MPETPTVVDVVAFGSCADEGKGQHIWRAVADADPDAFVFLGDNVYADTADEHGLRRAWRRLERKPGFRDLRKTVPVYATWDDHDYGHNDAGAEWVAKDLARDAFLDFLATPADSPRRTRPDGVYDAVSWGPDGQRVMLILLDTRFNRSPLRMARRAEDRLGQGPYVPETDPSATMLGPAQWAWLEARLREPADVHIVASSIPVLPEFTGWETWANFPHERRRLLDLVVTTGAQGVVFVSGDTHWSELSKDGVDGGYPMYELGTSGMTEVWPHIADNVHRLDEVAWAGRNFGLLRFDWELRTLTLEVRDEDGAAVWTHDVRLTELQP